MKQMIFNFVQTSLILVCLCGLTSSSFPHWQSIPLTGGVSFGYYYIEVEIGFPNPKKQNLIYDTGSSMIIVPCKGCTECNKNHDNGLYDPKKSATCQGIKNDKVYLGWNCDSNYNRE